MSPQEQDEVIKAGIKDAAQDLVKLMAGVAGGSITAGDTPEAVIARARLGLRNFVIGADLVAKAVEAEFGPLVG
jgi:hypothetical protein